MVLDYPLRFPKWGMRGSADTEKDFRKQCFSKTLCYNP